jgi:hypothetical protein
MTDRFARTAERVAARQDLRATRLHLDLAGCKGGRRAQAEALAATNASLLVASVGWYLLVRSCY